MIVYYEYVVIDNLIIDYLLLKTALELSGVNMRKIRVFLCAILGTGFALIFPLINLSAILLAAVKVFMGLLLVLLSAKFISRGELIKTAIIFFLLTFSIGGIVTGIYGLFSADVSGEIPVATVFIPVFIVVRFLTKAVKRVVKTEREKKLVVKVELRSGIKTVTAKGFFDTGNNLSVEGEPAVVIDKKIFRKLFTVDPEKFDLKMVAVTTVSGGSANLGITIEEAAIYFNHEPNIYRNVKAVVSKTPLTYGVILNPELKEEKNV